MAQISYIKYKDILEENRCDAEFHKIIFANKKLTYVKVEDVLSFIQYGISIDMNENNEGFKIYRMNEIENMFCNSDILKYANISRKEMETFKLEDRDVLFNRTNSFEFVGRTGIFKKFSDEDIIFASYLVRVRTDEKKVLPEYLTSFLNTKYGISDIKRRARISINQSNVSASELKKIKIPLIDLKIQEEIKLLFDASFKKQNLSKQLYREAEELLLAELGLLDYQVKHTLTFSTTKKEIEQAKRYDSEYFQPKYAEIINKIEKYEGGWDYAAEIIKWKKGVEVGTEAYTEKGKEFVRVSDFSIYGISESNRKISDEAFESLKNNLKKTRYFLPKTELLVLVMF